MGVCNKSPSAGFRGTAPGPGQGIRGALPPPPPEAESFLRIGHPKKGANWLHVRVLNERNCNFGEMGLMGEEKGFFVLQ